MAPERIFLAGGAILAMLAVAAGAFDAALRAPDIAQRLQTLGVEPVGGSSDAFRAYLMGERKTWAELARTKGIRLD